MGASGIAASEFPGLKWQTQHLASRLPLLLYLTHHDRDMETKKGTPQNLVDWVREWVDASPMYREAVPVDLTARMLGQFLAPVGQHTFLNYFAISLNTAQLVFTCLHIPQL